MTVCMHFCQSKGHNPDLHLLQNYTFFSVKKKTKFLEILPDSKLSFPALIKGFEKTCIKVLNLSPTMMWVGISPFKTLKGPYLIQIELWVLYIWNSFCNLYCLGGFKSEYQSLRLSLGAFRTSPAKQFL